MSLFKNSNDGIDMTEGPLLTKVLFFSIPLMLSGILQLVFNAADTIVVGRFAGNEALAAVGSVGSLNNMIISLFIGLSVGSNVLVATLTGARDEQGISDAVHTSVLLSLIGGVGLGIIGFIIARPMLLLMGSPEDVIDLATLYLRIIFIGLPSQMLYNFCSAILRAVGDTKRPLMYLSAAGVINVFLNLFFVIVFRLSVAGVALATIISQTFSAFLVTRCLIRMKGAVRLRPSLLKIHPFMLKRILVIGLPAGFQSSLFSLSNVVIQSSVNSFGSVVIAGNAAASNVSNFVYQAMNTFQQSVTSFVSQNMGARKPVRVVGSIKVCLFWSCLFGIVLGPISVFFGHPLLSLFTADENVIAAGQIRLAYICLPYFLCGIMDVMTGSLRGMGYSLLPMIVSLMGACVFRIVWIMTVFQAHHTIGCLLLSYAISWLITFAVLFTILIILWKRDSKAYTKEEFARV